MRLAHLPCPRCGWLPKNCRCNPAPDPIKTPCADKTPRRSWLHLARGRR